MKTWINVQIPALSPEGEGKQFDNLYIFLSLTHLETRRRKKWVRAEGFTTALMLIFITVPLVAPILTLLSAEEAAAQATYTIIARGTDTCYSRNEQGVEPWQVYEKGSKMPVMAAKKVGAGAVVAAGIGRTCNGGKTYPTLRWTVGELDVLLDKAFQWMKPGATKVLWYGKYGEGYNVYNDADACSWLIDNLKAKGYTVERTGATPITSAMLAPYDILVIPQLQLGDKLVGGDPSLLPDEDVEAIKAFVEGGGGLFLMEGADSTGYNFHEVQNKILRALDFGILFQHDSIVDEADVEPYVTVEVTNSLFGADYRAATGKTTIRLYRVNTLAEPTPGVKVRITPSYRSSLPGSTLTFSVGVTNIGKDPDSYSLTVSDNAGWGPALSKVSLLDIPAGKTEEVTLSVTIPAGAAIGAEDNIRITASSTKFGVSGSANCAVRAARKLTPPTDDTYTHAGRPGINFGRESTFFSGWYKHPTLGTGGPERAWLKFDLSVLPPGQNFGRVVLWVYNYYLTGHGSHGVQVHRVVDDSWTEGLMTWNNQPSIGEILDVPQEVTSTGWFSWDVTDFVQQELAGDKKVSFCLVDIEENIATDHSTWFSSKEYVDFDKWAYLEFFPSRAVEVTIKPKVQDASPGRTLTYAVTVKNTGGLADSYNLTVVDTKGWNPSISPSRLTNIAPLGSGTATLSVTIPSGTLPCTKDTITVTVTSQADPSVSASDTATVHAFEGTKLPPIVDAFVSQGSPDTNFGTTDSLRFRSAKDNNERIFLKFDLSSIPEGSTIISAEVWLWCRKAEFADVKAQIRKVTADAMVGETLITWGTQPAIGDVLDTVALKYFPPMEDMWHIWDVTSFVRSELVGDKIVSFAIRTEVEGANGRYTYASKEWPSENERPFLKVTYTAAPVPGVSVEISPTSKSGAPGGTLSYTITVTNMGGAADSYNLTASDTRGWSLSISPASLTVPAGESRTATLSVTIPNNAAEGDSTTITVTATSATDPTISDTVSCTALATGGAPVRRGVQVTISPASKSGAPGEKLDFLVTIKNIGAEADTFSLQATDTQGWGPTLAITSTSLPAGGERKNIKLSIQIPSNAKEGDSTTINVRAIGTGYENIAQCTATVAAGLGLPLIYVGAIAAIVVIVVAVLIARRPRRPRYFGGPLSRSL